MNYLHVVEILRRMENDARMIKLEERLIHHKRNVIKYKKTLQ